MTSLVTIRNFRLEVECPFTQDNVTALKQVKGLRYSEKEKIWYGPSNDVHTVAGAVEHGLTHGFTITRSADLAYNKLTAKRDKWLQLSVARTGEVSIPGLYGELRDFQKAGVAYMLRKQRTLLADHMGLGKTVQALAAVEAQEAFPCIVICPASVKYVWAREIEKWLPHHSYVVLSGNSSETHRELPDFVILNYDIVYKRGPGIERALMKMDARPQSIIFDEIHYCKNGKAKRTKACKSLALGISIRYGLSGTPAKNRISDLPSQLDVLGNLKEIGGSSWFFLKRYTNAYNNGFGWVFKGGRNLRELNERLRMTGYVRRTKKDVAHELHDKIHAEIEVDLTNMPEYRKTRQTVHKKLYERYLAEMSEELAERKTEQAKRLAELTALKKVAAQGKIKPAIEWIRDFLETEQPLIVFAHHREIVTKIADHFKAPCIIGQQTQGQRALSRTRFLAEKHLLVISMEAGGTGIDGLQEICSDVLFLELAWAPTTHLQCEGRVHRMGQKLPVNVWYMLARDTIDMYTFEVLIEKMKDIDAVTEGEDRQVSDSLFAKVLKRFMEEENALEVA